MTIRALVGLALLLVAISCVAMGTTHSEPVSFEPCENRCEEQLRRCIQDIPAEAFEPARFNMDAACRKMNLFCLKECTRKLIELKLRMSF